MRQRRRGRRRLRFGTLLFGRGGLLRGRRQHPGDQRFGRSTLESHAIELIQALRRRRRR